MNKKIFGIRVGTIISFVVSMIAGFVTWLLVNMM